jgi:hypothetical protein
LRDATIALKTKIDETRKAEEITEEDRNETIAKISQEITDIKEQIKSSSVEEYKTVNDLNAQVIHKKNEIDKMITKILATKFEIKCNENYIAIMDILQSNDFASVESTKQQMLEHCAITSFIKQRQKGSAELQKLKDKIEDLKKSQK